MTDSDIVAVILRAEGGIYTNHPYDAGGPTRWGITQRMLARWRGHAVTPEDVRDLEKWEATQIYVAWHLRPFDGIEDPLRVNAIDMGVNAGVDRAVRLLQQTIGVAVDGQIGPATRDAAKLRNWNTLYVGVRLAFYEDLILAKPMNLAWRNGWRNRALSFYDVGVSTLRATARIAVVDDQPIFGFMGKAA